MFLIPAWIMFILLIIILSISSVSKMRDPDLLKINIFLGGVSITLFLSHSSMEYLNGVSVFWLGLVIGSFNVFIRELSIFQSGKEGRYVINNEHRSPKIRFIRSFSRRVLWLAIIFLWLFSDHVWLVIWLELGFGYLVVFTTYEHECLWVYA